MLTVVTAFIHHYLCCHCVYLFLFIVHLCIVMIHRASGVKVHYMKHPFKVTAGLSMTENGLRVVVRTTNDPKRLRIIERRIVLHTTYYKPDRNSLQRQRNPIKLSG
jgi:hypothetical protein